MTSKKIISFIAGLVVTALIYFIVYFIIGFSNFTFFQETLEEKERMDAVFFFASLLLFIGTLLFIARQFKLNRRFVSFGVGVALTPLLYVLVVVTSIYWNDLFYYQPFDKAVWAKAKTKPFKMAKTLYKQKTLVGLSRKEIIERLGYQKESTRQVGTSLYFDTVDNWVFVIDLKNDTVIATQLQEPFFDL